MLFSSLIKNNYNSLKEAEDDELKNAVNNVITVKKLNTYKHASDISDDDFREAVQLIKDAVKNKFSEKEIKNALATTLFNYLPETERTKTKKGRKKTLKEADDTKTYDVAVGYCGFVGVEEHYSIPAKNKMQAALFALDEPGSEAEQDLTVEDIEDNGDGSYTVSISFGGIGTDEQYYVDAEDESEAEELALEEAKDNLEIISIDGKEFSYEDDNLNEAANPANEEKNALIRKALSGYESFKKNENALKKMGITGGAYEDGSIYLKGPNGKTIDSDPRDIDPRFKRRITTYSRNKSTRNYEKRYIDNSFDYYNYLIKPVNTDVPDAVSRWNAFYREDIHKKGNTPDDWADYAPGKQAGGYNTDEEFLLPEEKNLNTKVRKYKGLRDDVEEIKSSIDWNKDQINYYDDKIKNAVKDLQKQKDYYTKDLEDDKKRLTPAKRNLTKFLKDVKKSKNESEEITESLGDRYEVWQTYFEEGYNPEPEFVQAFEDYEKAVKFAEGLMQDPNCQAWVKDTQRVDEAEVPQSEIDARKKELQQIKDVERHANELKPRKFKKGISDLEDATDEAIVDAKVPKCPYCKAETTREELDKYNGMCKNCWGDDKSPDEALDATRKAEKDFEDIFTEAEHPDEERIQDLVYKIVKFEYDFDPYEYRDNFGDDEEAFNEVLKTLVDDNSRPYILKKYQEIIDEDNTEEAKAEAQELIDEIKELFPENN